MQSFGFYKTLWNGTIGKVMLFPEIEEQHQNPMFIHDWIEYSCFDAEITFFLYKTLHWKLKQLKIKCEDPSLKTNLDLYDKYWRVFGELLTEMERTGIKINVDHFRSIER